EILGGRTHLHLRRGVTYGGPDPDVARWAREGTRRFETIRDCVAWLRRVVPSAPQGLESPPASHLTDITQVAMPRAMRPTTVELERAIADDVLGQDAAGEALASLAAIHVAQQEPRRPASALLVGPTGTGKTLAAQRL